MASDRIRPLTLETFPAWRALAEKHDGVWGGYYCSYFHGVDGALGLIALAGGGEVVSFPNEPVEGRKTSSSFLHNGTRAMFEKAGFTFERHLGKRKTVMRRTVLPVLG